MADDINPRGTGSNFHRLKEIQQEIRDSADENVDERDQTQESLGRLVELEEETRKATAQRAAMEEELSRDRSFEESYYREREFGLLEMIHESLTSLNDNVKSAVSGGKAQQAADGDQSGGFISSLSNMFGRFGAGGALATLRGAGALVMRAAGPIAAAFGLFSFFQGFVDAEDILGRAPKGLVDKIGAGSAKLISDMSNAFGSLANLFLPENLQIPELSPQKVVQAARTAWTSSVSYLKDTAFPTMIGDAVDVLASATTQAVDLFGNMVAGVLQFVIGEDAANKVSQGIKNHFGGAIDATLAFTDMIGRTWDRFFGSGDSEIEFLATVNEMWQGMKRSWGGFVQSLQGLFFGALDLVGFRDEWDSAVQKIQGYWSNTVDFITGIWEWITSTVSDIKQSLVERFTSIKEGVVGSISGVFSWISETAETIKTNLTGNIGEISDFASRVKNSVVDGIKSISQRGMDLFSAGIDESQDKINEIKQTAERFSENLKDKFTSITDKISGWFNLGEDEPITPEEQRQAEAQIRAEQERQQQIVREAQLRRERIAAAEREAERRRQEGETNRIGPGPQAMYQNSFVTQNNMNTTVQEIVTTNNPNRHQRD